MTTRTCENCGKEFEGAPQARFDSAACQKAFRRKAAVAPTIDPALPELDVSGSEADQAREVVRPIEVLLRLEPFKPLSEAEEQLVRDHFGYSPTEKRTRAERERAAQKMLAGKPRVQMERQRDEDLAREVPKMLRSALEAGK